MGFPDVFMVWIDIGTFSPSLVPGRRGALVPCLPDRDTGLSAYCCSFFIETVSSCVCQVTVSSNLCYAQ